VPEQLIDEKKILTGLSERAIDRLLRMGEQTVKDYLAKWKNRDAKTYGIYLERKSREINKVRNVIFGYKNIPLREIYVPTTFLDKDFTDEVFIANFFEHTCDPKRRPTKSIGITASAGAGKSFFLRYCFLTILEMPPGPIPLFLEAKSFNRTSLGTIADRILDSFRELDVRVLPEQIIEGLRSGLFCVLLDGIDEMKPAIQSHYLAEIRSFVGKFPDCPFLASSRPGNFIHSAGLDYIFQLKRMSKPTVIQLLDKLEFDQVTKQNFSTLVGEELYESHYEYVSNPLLCTIMLLTYSENGKISRKRHEFYEDAFSALWSRHDVRKDGFERENFSGLDKNDFQRLLAAFSFSSYANGDYEFRELEFRKHFGIGLALTGIVCKEEHFRNDVAVSTCIMLEDGNCLRFLHRSFQEYFAAIFLLGTRDDAIEGLAEEISERIETDKVLQLAYSINPEKLERNWILKIIPKFAPYVAASSNSIEDYMAIVAKEGATDIGSGSTIRKLRIFYEFSPSTEDLLAAYDAGKHMSMRDRKNLTQSLFRQDRENFDRLFKDISRRYGRQNSALLSLLRGSAQSKTNAVT